MALQTRKRFGQHFLNDPGVIAHILQVIVPCPGQPLVEIGPGRGAITLPLLQKCEQLTVVELDRDLLEPLKKQCSHAGELRIVQGDALKTDFCQLFEPPQAMRIVGNLPYNISTPLLFHLLEQAQCIEDMHFMLQKEVVDRMSAAPGNKQYGRLSIMLQYKCQVTPLFSIPPEAFDPPPRVQSAFVRLRPHAQAPVSVDDFGLFDSLVKQAFSQRRKTVRNSLRTLLDESQLRSCGVDPTARPEQLTLEQFASLANCLAQL